MLKLFAAALAALLLGACAQTTHDRMLAGALVGGGEGAAIGAVATGSLPGALVGAAVPVIARRGLGPLGLALAAGWGAKKHYDRRQARRGRA